MSFSLQHRRKAPARHRVWTGIEAQLVRLVFGLIERSDVNDSGWRTFDWFRGNLLKSVREASSHSSERARTNGINASEGTANWQIRYQQMQNNSWLLTLICQRSLNLAQYFQQVTPAISYISCEILKVTWLFLLNSKVVFELIVNHKTSRHRTRTHAYLMRSYLCPP